VLVPRTLALWNVNNLLIPFVWRIFVLIVSHRPSFLSYLGWALSRTAAVASSLQIFRPFSRQNG
jgi:hypothetical protein